MLAFFPMERIRVELAQQSDGDSGGRGESGQYRSRNEEDGGHRPKPRESFTQCLFRLHEERSLYKGSRQTVTTLMISNAIFFYALNLTKSRLASLRHKQQSGKKSRVEVHRLLSFFHSKTGSSLIASIIAGCVNVMTTNPLWVASLRIMESKPSDTNNDLLRLNLWNVMNEIVKNEGVRSLWNGTSTSLLLVSNPIIQHFLYQQLRLWMVIRRRELYCLRKNEGKHVNIQKSASLTLFEAFVFGALAKAVATIATYPLQLAQILIRLQKKKLPPSNTNGDQHDSNAPCGKMDYYSGTLSCLHHQYSSGGVQALFKGINAKLFHTVFTAAFTFVTYEQTLRFVGLVDKRRKSLT